MSTRQVSHGVQFPTPRDVYDRDNETQFRRAVQDQLQAAGRTQDVSLPWVDVTDFGSSVGQGYDDTTAFTNAAAEALALGGTSLYIPGKRTYELTADVAIDRSVNITGGGAPMTVIHSASNARLKIGGATDGWGSLISGVRFDGVGLLYGETSGDFANGCAVADCEFTNATTAIVYRYNSFLNTIHRCRIHDCSVAGVQYDLATGGASSGAKQVISDSALFNLPVGVLYSGWAGGGFDLFVTNTDIEHITAAGVKTVGATEDSIFLNNVHFELYDPAAYFIVNDGAHIFVDGFWALSATEKAWISQSGGETYLRRGRGSWSNGTFAKITGGTIVVDPEQIFCAARWWGDGVTPMVAAGSSGGSIVNGRTRYVGQHNKTLTTITNAAPGPITAATISPRDGNERVFEFDVACSTTAANNILRIDLTNGHSTVRNDLAMPLVDGGVHLRVTHSPGGVFAVAGAYVPTTAGNGLWLQSTTTDTSTLADTRALTFETISGAGVKATMTISNFEEIISGPRQVGL